MAICRRALIVVVAIVVVGAVCCEICVFSTLYVVIGFGRRLGDRHACLCNFLVCLSRFVCGVFGDSLGYGACWGECACGCCSPRHTEKENEGDIVFVPLSYQ